MKEKIKEKRKNERIKFIWNKKKKWKLKSENPNERKNEWKTSEEKWMKYWENKKKIKLKYDGKGRDNEEKDKRKLRTNEWK